MFRRYGIDARSHVLFGSESLYFPESCIRVEIVALLGVYVRSHLRGLFHTEHAELALSLILYDLLVTREAFPNGFEIVETMLLINLINLYQILPIISGLVVLALGPLSLVLK